MLTNYSTLSLVLKYYGLKEEPKGSNKRILNWIKSFFPSAKDESDYSWCSIGLASILSENESFKIQITEANINPMARSWLRLPNIVFDLEYALPGDIVILTRTSNGISGHVALYVGENINDKTKINLLGCNQSDQVNIQSFNKANVIGIRRLN